jgi:hypothetical protein
VVAGDLEAQLRQLERKVDALTAAAPTRRKR